MPDLLTSLGNMLGMSADWRAAAGGTPPVPIGAPQGLGAVPGNIQAAQQLQQVLGPQAYDVLTGARKGGADQLAQVQNILGQQGTQNDLAGASRYIAGQDLVNQLDFLGPVYAQQLATLMNALYTADKGVSQYMGRPQGFLPGPSGPMPYGPTTSDASMANFLTAQMGMMSANPLMKFFSDLLTGNVTGERGPGAQTPNAAYGATIRG